MLDWSISSVSVMSSTDLIVAMMAFKSSIRIKKTYGPNHFPCGIPPVSVVQSKKWSPILLPAGGLAGRMHPLE